PHDLITIRPGSYNIIADNTIIGGIHNAVTVVGDTGLTTHNVVKNNKVTNRWHTGISVFKNSHNSIVEGNIVMDSGEDHAINFIGSDRDRELERHRHDGIKYSGNDSIIRNNILVNNGISLGVNGWTDFPAENNRFYNNTMFNNYT